MKGKNETSNILKPPLQLLYHLQISHSFIPSPKKTMRSHETESKEEKAEEPIIPVSGIVVKS